MKELLIKYRDKSKYDFSCSETIIHAANDFYNLNLSEQSFKMMAPFSGGMFERDTCGILTAGIAVLGIIFTEGVAHTSETLQKAVIEYKKLFKESYGSKICSILIESKRDEIEGCTDFIIEAGVLLEKVISKYAE